jgi:integrase
MGLYQKRGIWYYTFTHQGRRYQGSLKTKSKRLAEKLYHKITTEILEGEYFDRAKARKYTFQDLAERYMQCYQRQRDPRTIKYLLPVFGHLRLSEITPQLIAKYRADRLKKVKPATVYQELSLMRRMFNVAIREWGWIKDNPVSKLSFSVGNSNARDRWLTLEEEKRLLEAADRPWWLRPLLIVALHTGMRKGEILNLRWEDIDLKRRLITVRTLKGGNKRIIPISTTLYETLKGFKVRDLSGKVFPISPWTVRSAFDKAVKRAQIENFRFHDLRHTFATRLVQAGVDIYMVKELLGHKTITMTMRYAHHYPESLRKAIERLESSNQSATILLPLQG